MISRRGSTYQPVSPVQSPGRSRGNQEAYPYQPWKTGSQEGQCKTVSSVAIEYSRNYEYQLQSPWDGFRDRRFSIRDVSSGHACTFLNSRSPAQDGKSSAAGNAAAATSKKSPLLSLPTKRPPCGVSAAVSAPELI
jgi:hypothetical protein